MSDLSCINREIKDAMNRHFFQRDPDALSDVHRLAKKREEYLLSLFRQEAKP